MMNHFGVSCNYSFYLLVLRQLGGQILVQTFLIKNNVEILFNVTLVLTSHETSQRVPHCGKGNNRNIDCSILVANAVDVSFARAFHGQGQASRTRILGGDDKVGRVTADTIDETGAIGVDLAFVGGTDVKLVGRTLNMFTIIPHVQIVRSSFGGLVENTNATVAIVIDVRQVHCIAWSLDLGRHVTTSGWQGNVVKFNRMERII